MNVSHGDNDADQVVTAPTHPINTAAHAILDVYDGLGDLEGIRNIARQQFQVSFVRNRDCCHVVTNGSFRLPFIPVKVDGHKIIEIFRNPKT